MASRIKHALIALVGILFLASAIGVPTLVHQCCGVVSSSLVVENDDMECSGCCADASEEESSSDDTDCCSEKMVIAHAEVDQAPTPTVACISQPEIVYLPFEFTSEREMCHGDLVARRSDDVDVDPPPCDYQAKLGVFLI